MHEFANARRVIGFAGMGVMPSPAVVKEARQLIEQSGHPLPQASRVLQHLTLSVLPSEQACRVAVNEMRPAIVQEATERLSHASGPLVARPRG